MSTDAYNPGGMKSNGFIRPATAADAGAIRDVHLESIRGLCSNAYSPEEIEAWTRPREAALYAGAMAEGEKMMVAEVPGGRVVGFGALYAAEIRAVYVLPAFINLGIGSALLRALEERAFAGGHLRLHLQASLPAVRFYCKHGYLDDGPGVYVLADGTELQCRNMHKVLGSAR